MNETISGLNKMQTQSLVLKFLLNFMRLYEVSSDHNRYATIPEYCTSNL